MSPSEFDAIASRLCAWAPKFRDAGLMKVRVGEAEVVLGPEPPPKRPDDDDDNRPPSTPDAVDWADDGAAFASGRVPRRSRKARSNKL